MADGAVEQDLDDASDFTRRQRRVLRLELDDIRAHRLGQEAFVVGVAGAGSDETWDAVLDELLNSAGEGARGYPDLCGACFDLLP